MASLSISRRKNAWAAGVAFGATGHGLCELSVPKLKEIYDRGVTFGRVNADKPEVKAIVLERSRPPAPKPISRPMPRGRAGNFGQRPFGGPRRRPN